eukprot:TRINITY_DN3615_c0_g2_i1.p1 TRINITY_DN3615_c0_g2~~TRINITY_DN3615_c0_g2_i1.p1  ORF type:complete len:417 (-),score=83.40 TRINITY_DN3615_c0_g2_i1:151-1401(-)
MLSRLCFVHHTNKSFVPIRSIYSSVNIIGGGIMGSSVAYWLASANQREQRGMSIRVIEKDPTYSYASTTLSVGGIRQQFSTPQNIALSQFGHHFYQNIADYLTVGDHVPNINYRFGPYLFLASEKGLDTILSNHRIQKAMHVNVKLIPQSELTNHFPWLNPDGIVMASVSEDGEGWIDPFSLLMCFKKKSQELGVEFVQDSVVGIKTNPNGELNSLILASRGEVTCIDGAVVNCAGRQSSEVMAMLNLKFTVEARKRQVFVFESNANHIPPHLVIDTTGIYFRPEGKYWLTGCVPPNDSACDPTDFTGNDELFEDVIWPILGTRVPAFESLRLVNSWVGHYDYNSFDANAIVGNHPQFPNLYFATGFSGHGLQQSAGVGRGLSELLLYGKYRTLDLSCFSYDRVLQNHSLQEINII